MVKDKGCQKTSAGMHEKYVSNPVRNVYQYNLNA